METIKQELAQQPEATQPAEQSESQPENTEQQKKDLHNSATYAARLWHSAVKHAHPQKHTGIDI